MARPRQVTDEAIFDAVRESVREHGPSVATSTIAKKVGLSQAALFKRFGTKEALFVKSLAPNPPVEMLQLFAGGPDADQPIRPQLLALGIELQRVMSEMLPRLASLLACGYQPQDIFKHFPAPPPVMGLRAMSAWFGLAQERGLIKAELDTMSLAKSFFGSMFIHSHMDRLVGEWLPDIDTDTYVEQVVDTLLTGIALEAA